MEFENNGVVIPNIKQVKSFIGALNHPLNGLLETQTHTQIKHTHTESLGERE